MEATTTTHVLQGALIYAELHYWTSWKEFRLRLQAGRKKGLCKAYLQLFDEESIYFHMLRPVTWTGLLAMLIADLSHQKFSGPFRSSFTADRRLFIHRSSLKHTDIALYYASAVDRETTGCFLLLQDTKFPPTKTQKPDVDLLSSSQVA
jgi:hypothetical protein